MITIIGIDPGSYITGYGVISKQKNKINYLDSGCIYPKKDNFYTRLLFIYYEINKIIKNYQPQYLSIEQVFLSKNFSSSLKLGQISSVIILAATKLSVPVSEYSSKKVKKIITGNGSAEKKQVQNMVNKMLKLSINTQIDESDALAVALTHYYITL